MRVEPSGNASCPDPSRDGKGAIDRHSLPEGPGSDWGRWTAWPIAALFLVLPAVLLAPAWRLWGLSALEDGLLYYLPQRIWFGQALATGRWPLWHHLVYGGFPAFADPQIGMYYPSTWLFAVLDPRWAYPLTISLHHSLAAWLMYRLCRGLGRTRPAAVMAGVAFALCGFMLSHREHLTMHHAAAWTPGVLWAWHRWTTTGRVKHWAVGVVIVSAQLLAGHIQVTLMTGAVVVAYVIWSAPRQKRVWLGCLAGFAVAGLICAVQILPALRLLGHSAERRELYYVVYNSMLWRSLALLVFPMLLGQRTPNFYPVQWDAPSHQCEQTAYVTLVVLALTVGGGVLLWRRNRWVRFWGWAGLITLVLALGKNAGIYVLVMLIPLFNVLHTPARWLLIVHVALIVVGAAGADALLRRAHPSTRAERVWRRRVPLGLAAAAGAILLVFALAGWAGLGPAVSMTNPAVWLPLVLLAVTVVLLRRLSRRPGRAGGLVLIGLVVVDLAAVAPFLDVSTCGVEAITDSPSADALRRSGFDNATDRVWVIPGDAYRSPRQCLMPDTNLLDGVATLNGYGPMLPTELKDLFGFRPFGVTEQAGEWVSRAERLARLGVSHVIVRDDKISPAALADGWALIATVARDVRIYRNRHPAGLWYTAGRYRWCADTAEAVAVLREKDAESAPDREVLLTGGTQPDQTLGPGRVLSANIEGDTARFEVASDRGTMLVWLNRWYPGWRARVGDTPATIYRADVLGQAVVVPPGRHRIVFEFAPAVLQWSIVLSIAGLLVVGVLVFQRRFDRTDAGGVPSPGPV